MQEILRHLLASISYRYGKATGHADSLYAILQIGHGVRSPVEILHHMRGVALYAIYILTDKKTNMEAEPSWDEDERGFLEALKTLDGLFESNHFTDDQAFRIVQGPLADILTHIGQLAMLSRISGNPVSKINYSKAPIAAGKIGGNK